MYSANDRRRKNSEMRYPDLNATRTKNHDEEDGEVIKSLLESLAMSGTIQLKEQIWIYVLFQLVRLYLKMSLQMFLTQKR